MKYHTAAATTTSSKSKMSFRMAPSSQRRDERRQRLLVCFRQVLAEAMALVLDPGRARHVPPVEQRLMFLHDRDQPGGMCEHLVRDPFHLGRIRVSDLRLQ